MANELILVVEDNEQNQKLARDVLQVKGSRPLRKFARSIPSRYI